MSKLITMIAILVGVFCVVVGIICMIALFKSDLPIWMKFLLLMQS